MGAARRALQELRQFESIHELQLISFLNEEPFANLPGDFEKISPDGLTAIYEISFSNANIQRLNLEDRLDDIRNGSNGFASNMKVNGATVNLEDRADADGKSSKAVVEPILQHAPGNRWGVWVTGFGDFVNVDGDGNAQGYDFTTGGVTLGIDYRITDQLAIGVMGEYSHTWTSLQPGGSIDVNSGRGGVYATWSNHGIYLKAAWEHEYLYSVLPITAGIAGIPGPTATFFGPSEGHDSAVISAGVAAQWTPAVSTYVNYDGQLGRGKLQLECGDRRSQNQLLIKRIRNICELRFPSGKNAYTDIGPHLGGTSFR